MSSVTSLPSDEATPRAVGVAAIEHELQSLLRQPIGPEGQEMITWACMSNLVIFCATEEEHHRVMAEIGVIVQQHPSRVLVLVGDASDESGGVEAYVSASCHLLGGGRKCCSEHVTLAAGGSALRRLPSMVRSLLIGDLPTDLWWAHNQPPPEGGDLFRDLSDMADQVIYESISWPNPAGGVVTVANWAASPDIEQSVGDLDWRRLKPWRRILRQTLDPTILPGALESISEITVDHGPHLLPQVWLLVGWLANCLHWQPSGGKVVPGETLTWRFKSPSGPISITARRRADLPSEIHRIALKWREGSGPRSVEFAVVGANRLSIAFPDSDVPPRFHTSPFLARALLVAKQLPDRERDESYKQTLQVSRKMAETLV